MSARPSPAYIQGFLAAEADVCVLLRSGPGKKTLMVRWDLATDTFEIGQWLISWVLGGDLSDDGKLFVYRAYQRLKRIRPGETQFSYSVVCRPPYFTALAFWGDGNEPGYLRWTKQIPPKFIERPHRGILPQTVRQSLIRLEPTPPTDRILTCVLGDLTWRTALGKGGEYSLNGSVLDADWVGIDHRDRLLIARQGRIYVRDAMSERELIDLNPLEFQPVPAPAWAKEWPGEALSN